MVKEEMKEKVDTQMMMSFSKLKSFKNKLKKLEVIIFFLIFWFCILLSNFFKSLTRKNKKNKKMKKAMRCEFPQTYLVLFIIIFIIHRA